jgi:hypothetical protein
MKGCKNNLKYKKGMKENTCLTIKVHNYRIWWGTNINKNLKSDHMEFLHHLESSYNLGSGH